MIVDIPVEEAYALLRFVGDVLQVRGDAELMGKLLWTSGIEDVELMRKLRDRVGQIANAHLQAKLAAL